MVKIFKKWMYKALGQEKYLKLLSSFFPIGFKLGMLRNDPVYDFHYYVKNLIKPGFTVVDIGANMGYYTQIFAELTGKNGKVIAIEPVPPFYNTMKSVADRYPQCETHNVALGLEQKLISLSVPNNNGYLRTGLATIINTNEGSDDDFHFDAMMVQGSKLLENEKKIDYIKCDIEGYETVVIPELKNIIEKHKPMLQIETFGEQKNMILQLMKDWGYARYSLHEKKLVKDLAPEKHFGDFLFVYEK